MKKNAIALLVTLALALTVVVTPMPTPCCDNHDWNTDICSPPPISSYTFLPEADNG